MATTTYSSLRYPLSSATPNVSQDIQNLASDLDQKVLVQVASASARNALTAGQKYTNMRVQETSTGRVFQWDGTQWLYVPRGPQVFASIAARNSYYSGALAPIAGDNCMCLGTHMTYDGTAWRFMLTGTFSGSCDANGYFSFPHGGGQAPTAWAPIVSAQSTDSLTLVVKHVAWGFDGTNLTVRTVRTDSSTYLGANPVNGYWWAKF